MFFRNELFLMKSSKLEKKNIHFYCYKFFV